MNGKKTKLMLALTLAIWLLSNGGILSSHAEDEEHFSFYYEENPLYALGYNFTSLYAGSNYTWDFGDGNISYERYPVHVYAASGNYTVRLIVRDGGIEVVNESHILSTGNAPPIPDFMYTPNTPYTLETVFFTDNSTDPDGDIINWTWNFGDGSISYDKDPMHVYQKAGTYNVMLTVMDNEGKAASVVHQIIVFNRLPVASFYWTRYSITGVLIFDASTSYDPDGYIALYEWNLGDGTIKYGQTISHSYATAGAYTVTLTVYDDYNDSDTFSRTIHSDNDLPVVSFTYDPSPPTDLDVITFTSTSYDPDGTIVNYTWNFGDGSKALYNDTVTHQYADNGIYYVTLEVIDNEGAYNSTHIPITVHNVPPVAQFTWTPASPIPNKNITFNASTSYDLDGTIISWSWNFGDGNGSSGEVVTYTYGEDGTYTVTLTVMDDDGATTTIAQELFIADFYVDEHVFDPANHTWDKIQDAVDNATDGTFIYVRPGTYHEDVYIDKPIQMVGENAVIKGDSFSFYFDRDGIAIKNFIINGSTSGVIIDADNCLVENFTILGTETGVALHGNESIVRNSHISCINVTNISFLVSGNENTIENNKVETSVYGCQVYGTANVLRNNNIFGPYGTGVYGIYLNGTDNTIVENAIYNVNHGIYLLESNEVVNNTFTQCFNAIKLAHVSSVGYNAFISNVYGINASTYFTLNDATFLDNHVGISCYDILADNLTINGGDYGIIADYGTFTNVHIDGASVGVQVHEHVDMYNCSVIQCDIGIEGNSDGAIYNSRFSHNHVGIDNLVGLIENCSFTANTYGLKSHNTTIRSSDFSSNEYGVYMMGHTTVEQCSFTGNGMAVDVAGEENRVLNNEMEGNTHGIKVAASHNMISHNRVSNGTYGITITFSPFNTLFGNVLSANTYNFDMEGSKLAHFYQEIPKNNTINGLNMTYLINQSDILLTGTHGYLALINCTNVTITNVSISRNGEGVLLVYSQHVLLDECNFSYNLDGAYALNGASIALEEVTFTHNNNGASAKSSTNLSLSHCHIVNNINGINLFNIERKISNAELSHSWVGGNNRGINIENVEGVTVVNTTFDGNGKGMRTFNADMTVDHCTFSNDIDMDIIHTTMTVLYTEFSCIQALKADNAILFINNSRIHQAETGIHAVSSTIMVHNTTFENNTEGMHVVGSTIFLKHCIVSSTMENIFHDTLITIQSSAFTGNVFGIHLYHSSGIISESNFASNIHAVVLENDTSIDMVNLTISENEYGVIVNTSSSRIYGGLYLNNSCALTINGNGSFITGVLFHHNSRGVVMKGENNTLLNSSFWKNLYGIIAHGNNNTIYHNNFVYNVENARDYGNNIWNISYPEGGNFWHDYAGEDHLQGAAQNMSGSDDIGDVPYELYGNEDHYPLMTHYEHAAAVPNEPPVAQFYYYPTAAFSLETVIFVDTSSDENGHDDIVSWHWDFGDGNTSTEKHPKHAYARYGVFNVTLTVADREGSTNSTRMQVMVRNLAPVANFSWTPDEISSHTLVELNASTSYDLDGIIMNYSWDFGDGTTSDDPVITHKYVKSGTYTVTLTVTDDAGETGVLEIMLEVHNRKPDAEFTFDPEEVRKGDTITFSDLSSDIDGEIVEWRWDFGDGSMSYEQNPTHIYERKGTYTVTLQVKDDEGAQTNYSATITIKQNEIPSFELIIAFVAIILVAFRRLKKFK